MSTRTTITTSGPHNLREGDIVEISTDSGRVRILWQLLKRPRVKVVGAVSLHSYELLERRMTWAEWGQCLRRLAGL